MDGYANVWEKFKKERRLEFGGHTDSEWQRGYSLSASFVAPVEISGQWARLEPLREALKPFPFVSLHPEHFMHVTLALLGLLPESGSEGELSRERLAELETRAREALKDFPAFTVELANLNAFPAAVFMEVRDGGMLEAMRDALREVCGLLEEPKGPLHLTLAYLQAPDGALVPDEFVATIERYRDWNVGTLSVERVDLTLLDLNGSKYPQLDVFAEIQLGN